LSSLEDGEQMFAGCKLDEESILNIVDSINDYGQDGVDRKITIGFNSDILEEDYLEEEFGSEFIQKGWTVEWIASA
jgi:hypothetical protein